MDTYKHICYTVCPLRHIIRVPIFNPKKIAIVWSKVENSFKYFGTKISSQTKNPLPSQIQVTDPQAFSSLSPSLSSLVLVPVPDPFSISIFLSNLSVFQLASPLVIWFWKFQTSIFWQRWNGLWFFLLFHIADWRNSKAFGMTFVTPKPFLKRWVV